MQAVIFPPGHARRRGDRTGHADTAEQDTGPGEAYWRFHDAVAQAQFRAWIARLAPESFLVDISGPASQAATLAAEAGHRVLRVADPAADGDEPADQQEGRHWAPAAAPAGPAVSAAPAPGGSGDGQGHGGGSPHARKQSPERAVTGDHSRRQVPRSVRALPQGGQGGRVVPPGRGVTGGSSPGSKQSLWTVAADGSGLEFLADGCADGVVAEDRALSRRLAAETLMSEIWRVLRPGGRVLASVDSLTLGMAVLAEQHRWPHLVDLPHADVVLIPWPDGTFTRCYGTQQLRELFTASGFKVDWICPRTVLSASTVSYLLARDPGSFPRLIQAELQASADDSVGAQLVISARKK